MQNKDKIPVEIITKRDIVNILDKLTIDFRTTLSSFMSEPIISIHANDKLVGIITQKDIFMQIDSNLTMVTNFVGQKYPVQYREVYEKFTEYV